MLLRTPQMAEERMSLSAVVKLVCLRARRALLLRQADDSWDLPGGRLEDGEGLLDGLAREVEEELGPAPLPLLPGVQPVGEWLYVRPERRPRIVTFYRLQSDAPFDLADLRLSDEHCEAAWVGLDELGGLDMPQGYRDAVRTVLSA